MLPDTQRDKLRKAFQDGTLRVQALSPDGDLAWKCVLDVSRAEIDSESVLGIQTEQGMSVLTGGHRVFITPTAKVESDCLQVGLCVGGGAQIKAITELPSRKYMFDITTEDWHNFKLYRSGLVVSNCPDRNYHFRPPAHEDTINQYNQVFGYIWEEEELVEYLDRGLDMIIAAPPRTPFNSIDQMAQYRPEWRTLLLTGAMMHALQALRINWAGDEFSYSIGGISLDLEKASKYESALSYAAEQFASQLEKAKLTCKYTMGLQQPRYGIGIRSSFGPFSGNSVLSPAKFVGM